MSLFVYERVSMCVCVCVCLCVCEANNFFIDTGWPGISVFFLKNQITTNLYNLIYVVNFIEADYNR